MPSMPCASAIWRASGQASLKRCRSRRAGEATIAEPTGRRTGSHVGIRCGRSRYAESKRETGCGLSSKPRSKRRGSMWGAFRCAQVGSSISRHAKRRWRESMRNTVPLFREQMDMITRSHSAEPAGSCLSPATSKEHPLPPNGSKPGASADGGFGDG